jgi:hypothetical protein
MQTERNSHPAPPTEREYVAIRRATWKGLDASNAFESGFASVDSLEQFAIRAVKREGGPGGCMNAVTRRLPPNRYGHLMPGNEEEAAELLDAYFESNVVTKAPALI